MLKQSVICASFAFSLLGVGTIANANAGPFVGGAFGYHRYNTGNTASNVTVDRQWPTGGVFAGYLWGKGLSNYGVKVAVNMDTRKEWKITNDTFFIF